MRWDGMKAMGTCWDERKVGYGMKVLGRVEKEMWAATLGVFGWTGFDG